MTERLDIGPHTRVGALLDAYPQLEQVLIEHAPVFAKLRNPVLRRTVARVATLERAAGVAGTPVRALVARLRAAVDLPELHGPDHEGPTRIENAPRPAWANGTVVATLDADALLESGQVPLAPLSRHTATLQPGQVVRLDASFRPTPLLETLRERGYVCHVEPHGAGFRTTVAKLATPENQ